ncbi:MAG: flagellar motor switch protein FliN [Candidatus Eremiobacteraeota bacterium]|nr:flagellar motor switch protein FliN [Candidatus Eremiobacteraeota bacterium]
MISDARTFGGSENVGLLMHVPLHLTVELGSCEMSIAEILKLGTGSIVELERAASHPVDLLANSKPIARGEIVAIEEKFGLRITELLV